MKQRDVMLMINPPIPARFNGIAAFAREHQWHLTVANRLVHAQSGWHGDGALITVRNDLETLRFVKRCQRLKIPVVDLTAHKPRLRIPRVLPDYRESGRLAARHFQDRGFTRSIWFASDHSHVHLAFYEGFSAGWTQPPEKLVLSDLVPVSQRNDGKLFAATVGKQLKRMPKPVAILTYNDEEAARLIDLCLRIGLRVPEECAVMGIGNDEFICTNQAIPASSVDDNLFGNGYMGAELLERLMNGETPPAKPITVPVLKLVERQSTNIMSVDDPRLDCALKLLVADIVRPPSASELAEAVGLSRSTLDRLFLKKLGRSQHDELQRLRFARVLQLLNETDLPLSDIAAECGFCNPGYLVNAFKRQFGVTPAHWRQSHTHHSRTLEHDMFTRPPHVQASSGRRPSRRP